MSNLRFTSTEPVSLFTYYLVDLFVFHRPRGIRYLHYEKVSAILFDICFDDVPVTPDGHLLAWR